MLGIPQDYKSLLNDFRIQRRSRCFGIKYMCTNNHDRVNVSDDDMTHSVYARKLVTSLGLNGEDFDSIVRLRNLLHNRSSVLNRARPQSLAVGLVLYILNEEGQEGERVDTRVNKWSDNNHYKKGGKGGKEDNQDKRKIKLPKRMVFVACPYMGMQLSYSSKFRVALSVVPAVENHVTDSYDTTNTEFFRRAFSCDVNTLICTVLFTAFVEET